MVFFFWAGKRWGKKRTRRRKGGGGGEKEKKVEVGVDEGSSKTLNHISQNNLSNLSKGEEMPHGLDPRD